jgi:hypothetical protein
METSVAVDDAVVATPAPLGPTLNGWTPDVTQVYELSYTKVLKLVGWGM